MHLKKLEPHFNRMKKYSPCSTIPESIIFQRLALQASDCRSPLHCHYPVQHHGGQEGPASQSPGILHYGHWHVQLAGGRVGHEKP